MFKSLPTSLYQREEMNNYVSIEEGLSFLAGYSFPFAPIGVIHKGDCFTQILVKDKFRLLIAKD